MELRHLRYFVAVAEELHFGRAADMLHIAQPALSIQIKSLERELGGALLERSSRSVNLTDAGRAFLREARATLAQAERAVDVAGRVLRGELGVLDIAYSGNAAFSGMLGHAIQAFRRDRPDVDIGLRELDPVSQVSQLLARRIQLGFATTLCVDIPPALGVKTLGTWPLRLALPAEHPLARAASIPLSSLSKETFIVYADADGDDGSRLIRSLVGLAPCRTRRASNIMQVLSLVAAGQGVAVLPASLQALASGTVFRPVEGLDVQMDSVVLFWRDGHEPVVDAFLRALGPVAG